MAVKVTAAAGRLDGEGECGREQDGVQFAHELARVSRGRQALAPRPPAGSMNYAPMLSNFQVMVSV